MGGFCSCFSSPSGGSNCVRVMFECHGCVFQGVVIYLSTWILNMYLFETGAFFVIIITSLTFVTLTKGKLKTFT
jgi:hypothetical protein